MMKQPTPKPKKEAPKRIQRGLRVQVISVLVVMVFFIVNTPYAARTPDATATLNAIGTNIGDASATLNAVRTDISQQKANLESLQLAGLASSALSHHQNEFAALLSIRALNAGYTVDADVTLQQASSLLNRRQFIGHTDGVFSVAFSPDGRYALSGNTDGTLRLWDVASGGEIMQFIGHSAVVTSVAFSPDGRYVLSGSLDGTLRLWEVAGGHEVRQFIRYSTWMSSVAFSPDGRYILSGSTDVTVRLWEIDYHPVITSTCRFLVRDFTEQERKFAGITDDRPTCPQFAADFNPTPTTTITPMIETRDPITTRVIPVFTPLPPTSTATAPPTQVILELTPFPTHPIPVFTPIDTPTMTASVP